MMEAFFSTVKSELADRFPGGREAKMALFDHLEVFYNQGRRHSTLGYMSPAAFERAATAPRRSAIGGDEGDQEGMSHPRTTRRSRLLGPPVQSSWATPVPDSPRGWYFDGAHDFLRSST